MFPHKLPFAMVKREPIWTNVTMVMTYFLRVWCHCKFLWLSESKRIFLCKWRHVPCVMMSSIFCSLTILNIRKHGLLTALITEPVCAITTMGSKKNLSTPEMSETYDVLVTSPDALPLSYRILEGFKAIRLQWWTKVLLRHFYEMAPLT